MKPYRFASLTETLDNSMSVLSDQEFLFSSVSGDSSDAESLPDLTDDTSSIQSISTPIKPSYTFFGELDLPSFKPRVLFQEPQTLPEPSSVPSIFDIPELVYKIIEFADLHNTVIPKEKAPVRRKPLSFRHAMLLHGNEKMARLAMESSVSFDDSASTSDPNVLHTCLLVNKLFNKITREIMGTHLLFTNETSFCKFIRNADNQNFCSSFKPNQLVLNKLFCLKQASLDRIANSIDYSSLEWFELFMCPKLLPTDAFLHSSLKTLIITGSKTLDDSLLILVAQKCPNLEVLDVRACEGVTDYGVHAIGSACTKLVNVNLGRKKRGHLITDHSVSALATNNPRLTSVGLAGCYITDRSIWELAMNCGSSLERLSLNNCPYISNQSVPTILHHNLLPQLLVLEIRYVLKITNVEPIITFRRRQNARGISMLLETCEALLIRMKEHELRMDSAISERIFHDISEWANAKDDDDEAYAALLTSRTS